MKLGTGLQVNTTLTKIDLFGNSIRNEGAALLAHSLKQNYGVSSLDLRWNVISNAGAEELLSCLKINTTLTHLDLGGNNINNKTCLQAINQALQNNSIINMSKRKLNIKTLPNLNLKLSDINTSLDKVVPPTPGTPTLQLSNPNTSSMVTILTDTQPISGDDNPIVTYISDDDDDRDVKKVGENSQPIIAESEF